MKKLIVETSRDIEVKGSNKSMYIEGCFAKAGKKNANGRVYKRTLLDRELKKLKDKLDNKRLFGELSHPESPTINLDRVCMITEQLEWHNDELMGKAKILNTNMGKIAQELIRKSTLGVSSRGLGTIDENGYVNEDFRLITFDLVDNPSNEDGYVNGIYEAREFEDDYIETKEDRMRFLNELIDELKMKLEDMK